MSNPVLVLSRLFISIEFLNSGYDMNILMRLSLLIQPEEKEENADFQSRYFLNWDIGVAKFILQF